jgi:hypothetical protein
MNDFGRSFARVITGLRERVSALAVGLSLATVTLATGFISYTHISALTVEFWQNWKTAHLMPLAVDGQIVIGSVYFMEHSGEKRRWLGLIGVVPGIAESLYSNWESVTPPPGTPWLVSFEAHLWATVPAQAFACSTILFERWVHSRRQAQGKPGILASLATLAAAPLAMARLAAELEDQTMQAPEPAAPEVQEAGPVPVHLHGAPEGAPWGLVSPAVAPAQPPEVPGPVQAIPVLGPVMHLTQRPKQPRVRQQAEPDQRLPLPQDEEELRELLASLSQNEFSRQYRISRYGAGQLKKKFEDVTVDAA